MINSLICPTGRQQSYKLYYFSCPDCLFWQEKASNPGGSSQWPSNWSPSSFNQVKSSQEAFYSAYKNDAILTYHWSIKIYTCLPLCNLCIGIPLVIYIVHMTSFFIGTVNTYSWKEWLYPFIPSKKGENNEMIFGNLGNVDLMTRKMQNLQVS